jgi:hypothetical protein
MMGTTSVCLPPRHRTNSLLSLFKRSARASPALAVGSPLAPKPQSAEKNIIQHCLLKCLHEAHTGDLTPEERARKVIGIDKEGKTYMCHVEKICRNIISCWIPFLPNRYITLSSGFIKADIKIVET